MSLNLLGLSVEALIKRKNEVIQQNHKQINDLEQDYFTQMNQLYIIKQSILREYQQSLLNQLSQINVAIQQKLSSSSSLLSSPSNIPSIAHQSTIETLEKTERAEITDSVTTNSSNSPNPTSITSISPSTTSNHSHHIQYPLVSNLIISNLPNNHNNNNNNNNNHHMNMNHNKNLKTFQDNTLNLPLPKIERIDDEYSSNTDNKQYVANGNNSDNKPSITPTKTETETVNKDIKRIKDIKDIKDIKPTIHESIECNLCHQAFDSMKSLREHLNTTHTFKCDLCSKTFQKSIDLKRHQRIHDGVAVYECKVCYKTYTSPGSLHNHQRLHNVSSLFRCEYCGKGFTQNHHLKRHLRIHTGVTPFRCRYCERPFKYKTSCQRHEKTVHKQQYVAPANARVVGRPKTKK